MSLEMSLWRFTAAGLERVMLSQLKGEDSPEDCIEPDLSVLGMELAVMRRQEQTQGIFVKIVGKPSDPATRKILQREFGVAEQPRKSRA